MRLIPASACRRRTTVCLIGLLACAVAPLRAVAEPAAAPTAAPADKAAAAKAEQEQKQQARIAKIAALSFDRRVSTLLGGTLDLSEPQEAAEAGDGDPSAAMLARMLAQHRAAKPGQSQPAAAEAKDPFDDQLAAFKQDVERSRWKQAAAFLASLAAKEAEAATDKLLDGMAAMPPPEQGPHGQPLEPERPVITVADVVGLARAIPLELDEKRQQKLGAVAKLALAGGAEADDLVKALAAEAAAADPNRRLDRRGVAVVLAEAGRADLADAFVPAVAEAVQAKDFAGLKLRMRQLRGARGQNRKQVSVDELWQAALGLVSIAGDKAADRRYAIEQVAELLPQLPRQTATDWVTRLVADRPAEARELVSAIAARVAAGLQKQPQDVAERTQWLGLLDRAIDAVTGSPAAADPAWKEPLALAARAWTAEGDHSATHASPDAPLRRDPYGNIYYWEEQRMMQQMHEQPQLPVKLADAIDTRPDAAWIAVLDPAGRPAVERVIIRLQCKAGEPERALPLLEQLAATHPETARGLVSTVLDAWKLAHNPNDERTRRAPFFWYYGMEERQGGIPLSRSLQERNLADLAALVKRLEALPLEGSGKAAAWRPHDWIDERLLVECFTACHSVAEVYRPEAMAAVFGPLDGLSAEAAAALAEKMRANLADTWRKASVQEQAKTKRREADIKAEVFKGYDSARGFLAGALDRHPGHWALLSARAALAHDENDYRRRLEDTPEFTKNRRAALDEFAKAAAAYVEATRTLPRDEWTLAPFETWFLAGCGGCDADRIDETTQRAPGESDKVRDALAVLGAEAREWHLDRFAATLVARLSKLSPAVKERVVREGLTVAGDHPKARDARKVLDYYSDLVREIELRTEIDGPDRVGHGRPFGVLVSLRHTREIEREAGGFGRYLQNQKAFNGFMYNFGRPLENYRDKFEDAARKALGEFFDVKSVTFQSEDVKSRSEAEYGWRRTPYAYLVLAAKSPTVDRLPPLRLDLDFLDTSGFVILPIESRGVGLDAAGEAAARPATKLAVTQLLDDRKAREGKVILEVRATARGLVPDLEALLDTKVPGFEVQHVRDDGLAVSRFDPESSEPVVLSERSWVVTFAPVTTDTTGGRFAFPTPKTELTESVLQRYADADLVTAEPVVEIGRPLASRLPRGPLLAALAAAVTAAAALCAGVWWAVRHPTAAPRPAFATPEPATPFSVLQLLRDIQSNNGLDERGHADLRNSIDSLERRYFAADEPPSPGDAADLAAVARAWVARARPRR